MALFNINNDGSRELSDITGQWYASSQYSLISTEVDLALGDVAARIGKAVVEAAERDYQERKYSPLVKAVQLPVACLAIMRYMKLATLSHEQTGRKVKMDDNEKIPFEWMVDRDDQAMRERYYRAMDALYRYLQDNDVPEWVASGKTAAALGSIVRTIQEFEAVYPLDGSYYVYYMLQDLVVEAQNSRLKAFLGDIWPTVADGSADPAVCALARKVAILSAIIIAGERWSLQVFPIDIARRFSPSYQGNRATAQATKDEIEWYLSKLRSQLSSAYSELGELTRPVSAEPALIPENDRKRKYFTTV